VSGPYGLSLDFQVWDPLTSDEYESLKASIAEHGITVPIVITRDDEVLDGHHRLREDEAHRTPAQDEAKPDWHKLASRYLDESRPERSVPGTDDPDHAWIDRAADAHAEIVPEAEARKLHLRAVMHSMESANRRSTRRFFRRIAETKQWPLDWMDLRDEPLTINDQGTAVKLRYLTDADLDDTFRYMEREKRNNDRAYIATVDGIDWVRKALRNRGVAILDGLHEEPPDDGAEDES
jgi:hypothetical protein